MSLEKVIGKNKQAAKNLVVSINRDISKNQKALNKNAEEHRQLIETGEELTLKLAAAEEYLADLLESEQD